MSWNFNGNENFHVEVFISCLRWKISYINMYLAEGFDNPPDPLELWWKLQILKGKKFISNETIRHRKNELFFLTFSIIFNWNIFMTHFLFISQVLIIWFHNNQGFLHWHKRLEGQVEGWLVTTLYGLQESPEARGTFKFFLENLRKIATFNQNFPNLTHFLPKFRSKIDIKFYRGFDGWSLPFRVLPLVPLIFFNVKSPPFP